MTSLFQVVHATYPWCPHCRDYLPFLEAVKLKKLRKKVRKLLSPSRGFNLSAGSFRFSRWQRTTAAGSAGRLLHAWWCSDRCMQMGISCEKPLTGQKSEAITGCNRSLYVYKSGEFLGTYDSRNNDTDPERLVRYLQVHTQPLAYSHRFSWKSPARTAKITSTRAHSQPSVRQAMAGPFPKRVKQMSDLNTLKKDYELTTVIPVGIFDPAENAEEFDMYTKYAAARRAEGRCANCSSTFC